MIENKHYELIPGEDDKWNVRILEGPYVRNSYSIWHIDTN